MIGGLRYVHVHLAGPFAPAAVNALVPIHLHARQRYPVKQRVERAQRAQPLAERAVEQNAQHDHRQQDAELPGEKLAERRPDAGVGKREGDRPLQHALRAQVLAEEGVAHPHLVGEDQRQRQRQRQDDILEIGQRLELFGGRLLPGKRDLVKQLLEPSEGAQEAAHNAPKQYAQQDQRAGYIVGKLELG